MFRVDGTTGQCRYAFGNGSGQDLDLASFWKPVGGHVVKCLQRIVVVTDTAIDVYQTRNLVLRVCSVQSGTNMNAFEITDGWLDDLRLLAFLVDEELELSK